jgi:hypothetical protein
MRHYPIASALEIADREPGSLELMRGVQVLLERTIGFYQDLFAPRAVDIAQRVLCRTLESNPIFDIEIRDIVKEWMAIIGRGIDISVRKSRLIQIWDWFAVFSPEDQRSLSFFWIAEMFAAGADSIGEERIAGLEDLPSRMECMFRIAVRLDISGEHSKQRDFWDRYDQTLDLFAQNLPLNRFSESALVAPIEKFESIGDRVRVRKILLLGTRILRTSNDHSFKIHLACLLFYPAIRMKFHEEVLDLLAEIPTPGSTVYLSLWSMFEFLAFSNEAGMCAYGEADRLRLFKVAKRLLGDREGEALALLVSLAESKNQVQMLMNYREACANPERVVRQIASHHYHGKIRTSLLTRLSMLAPYNHQFAERLLLVAVENALKDEAWEDVGSLLQMLPSAGTHFFRDLAAEANRMRGTSTCAQAG